jgi:hypothetical protein
MRYGLVDAEAGERYERFPAEEATLSYVLAPIEAYGIKQNHPARRR